MANNPRREQRVTAYNVAGRGVAYADLKTRIDKVIADGWDMSNCTDYSKPKKGETTTMNTFTVTIDDVVHTVKSARSAMNLRAFLRLAKVRTPRKLYYFQGRRARLKRRVLEPAHPLTLYTMGYLDNVGL